MKKSLCILMVLATLFCSLTGSAIRTAAMTGEYPTYYETDDWYSLYDDFLSEKKYLEYSETHLKEAVADNHQITFALYDMNADRVPELIIGDIYIRYSSTYVFTVKDNSVVYAGQGGSASMFYDSHSDYYGLFSVGVPGLGPDRNYSYSTLSDNRVITKSVVKYSFNGSTIAEKIEDEELFNAMKECTTRTDTSIYSPKYSLENTYSSDFDSMSWDAFVEKYGFRRFRLDRDANNYAHIAGDIDAPNNGFKGRTHHTINSKKIWYALVKLCSTGEDWNILRENILFDDWHGSCYGMALTMGKLYNGDISLSDLTDNPNAMSYFGIGPDDEKLHDMIEYYYLTQKLKVGLPENYLIAQTYKEEKYKTDTPVDTDYCLEDFLSKLIVVANNDKAYYLIKGYDNNKGHIVLILDAFFDPVKQEYDVILYDGNSVKKGDANTIGSFTHMYINRDCTEFHAEGTGAEKIENYNYLRIMRPSSTELDIPITNTESDKGTISTGSNNQCDVTVNMEYPFVLKDSLGNTLTYDGNSFSGNINIHKKTVNADESGMRVTLTVDKDTYTMTGGQKIEATISDGDDYHSIHASNFTSAALSLSDGVTVNGNKCHFDIFTSTKKIINDLGESVLVKISGDAEKSVTVKPGYDDVTLDTGKTLTDVSVTNYIDNQQCDEQIGTVTNRRIIPNLALPYGDVDGNGEITPIDATKLQYYLADMTDLAKNQKIAADANADDEVDIVDATVILRYRAGIIDKLGLDYLALTES